MGMYLQINASNSTGRQLTSLEMWIPYFPISQEKLGTSSSATTVDIGYIDNWTTDLIDLIEIK